jgi:hypothetical protein
VQQQAGRAARNQGATGQHADDEAGFAPGRIAVIAERVQDAADAPQQAGPSTSGSCSRVFACTRCALWKGSGPSIDGAITLYLARAQPAMKPVQKYTPSTASVAHAVNRIIHLLV